MPLIFLVTVPLGVGVIIWAVQLLAARNSNPMVRREITAPDGRKAVFVVPASEPASVSIARMYADGVVPAEAAHQDRLPVVKAAETPRPASAPRRRMSRRERLFWIGLAGLVV